MSKDLDETTEIVEAWINTLNYFKQFDDGEYDHVYAAGVLDGIKLATGVANPKGDANIGNLLAVIEEDIGPEIEMGEK